MSSSTVSFQTCIHQMQETFNSKNHIQCLPSKGYPHYHGLL
ncbi:hypothetical protein LINGRAHAP2_LOCUS1689 [Linum grandiflorum]